MSECRSSPLEPQATDLFPHMVQSGGNSALKALFVTYSDAEIVAMLPSMDVDGIRRLRDSLQKLEKHENSSSLAPVKFEELQTCRPTQLNHKPWWKFWQ